MAPPTDGGGSAADGDPPPAARRLHVLPLLALAAHALTAPLALLRSGRRRRRRPAYRQRWRHDARGRPRHRPAHRPRAQRQRRQQRRRHVACRRRLFFFLFLFAWRRRRRRSIGAPCTAAETRAGTPRLSSEPVVLTLGGWAHGNNCPAGLGCESGTLLLPWPRLPQSASALRV